MALPNGKGFRFPTDSKKMVNFQQDGLLDVVTEEKIIKIDKYKHTVTNINSLYAK